jgi:cysteine synthase B
MDYIKARRPHLFSQQAKAGGLQAFDKTPANDAYSVQAGEAQAWIDANSPAIIDVRGNLAYKMTTLPGAVNIPWELFEPMIDAADPFPKDKPLLLVCPVGEKTTRYAAYLTGRGYKAFSLGGGILAWRNANQKLVKVA